jgi:hypothetical protein
MWVQIIKNNDFTICKLGAKFQINTNFQNQSLLNSITKTKIVHGATITDHYKTLYFNATSVKTFSMYQSDLRKMNGSSRVPYNHVVLIFYYLGKQLEHLIKNEDKCFYAYNPDNIIVIDDNKFIYLSENYLADIENKDDLIIVSPFDKERNCFMCPKIRQINELPFSLSHKTSYYSLCLFLIYALSCEMDFLEETGEPINKRIEELLKPIIDTKLYYAIKRGLIHEPEKRSILYI